eukprot:g12442.t1
MPQDVEPIIKENEGSKLQRLMTEKLSWALEVGSCWLHWKSISRPGGSPRMCAGDLPQKLLETESQCQALQNDRPRLLLQKKMGSKVKRVEPWFRLGSTGAAADSSDVDFYRADLTDLPFEFGETCFFLVSKFSDLPMAEMLTNRGTALGSLACRFDGLQEHMAIIEATGRLEDYVMVANPEAVHHLHVFEDLPHEDTAQQIREYFSGGRTVGETSIDELQRQLRDVGFARWLEAFHLHAALENFIEKAQQTVAERKDYHLQLSSSMRELIGRFVEHFLMASFGPLGRTAMVSRAGSLLLEAAHWTPKKTKDDVLAQLAEKKGAPRPPRPPITPSTAPTSPSAAAPAAPRAASPAPRAAPAAPRAASPAPRAAPATPRAASPAPRAAPAAPRAASPASPASASPASPTSPAASPGGSVQIQLRKGGSYWVKGGLRYVVQGREDLPGLCQSHLHSWAEMSLRTSLPMPVLSRKEERCRNPSCIFSHPEEEEESMMTVMMGISSHQFASSSCAGLALEEMPADSCIPAVQAKAVASETALLTIHVRPSTTPTTTPWHCIPAAAVSSSGPSGGRSALVQATSVT